MNIIYFNPDEMRADLLGCYGHPLAKTPNFDRLAAAGTRFDQCHVQHTVCSPSRCSFTTGWYPHTAGHRTLWNLLRSHEPNTFAYLKEAGYETHHLGKNDWLAPDAYDKSISHLHAFHGGHGGSPDFYEKGEPGFMSFLRGPMDHHAGDYHTVEKAVAWLRSRPADAPPFAMFIAIGFPHCPYTAPEPWYSMYDPDDLPPLKPADLENRPDFHRLIRRYRDLDKMDEKDLRKLAAVYLGMVSYVDHMLGLLLDALDDTGLASETAVFAFSDHGDWGGNYGLVEKWPSGLDDDLTRIPMIVRAPGMKAGHVVDEPIECFDIMPTTLELAGVECRHTHFARSMLPQLRGEPGDPDRAAFADGGYDTHEPQCFEGKPSDGVCGNPDGIYYPKGQQQQNDPGSVRRCSMIRTGTHKLVWRPGGQHELYDCTSDPDELHNLYGNPEHAAVQTQLTERLLDWYVHTADITPWDTNPRGFDMPPSA